MTASTLSERAVASEWVARVWQRTVSPGSPASQEGPRQGRPPEGLGRGWEAGAGKAGEAARRLPSAPPAARLPPPASRRCWEPPPRSRRGLCRRAGRAPPASERAAERCRRTPPGRPPEPDAPWAPWPRPRRCATARYADAGPARLFTPAPRGWPGARAGGVPPAPKRRPGVLGASAGPGTRGARRVPAETASGTS